MAPLSHQLSGLILPYDHFGTHLDSKNNTVDKELKLKIFKHAGEILAAVWNEMVVDGYSVHAEYVPPQADKILPPPEIDEWYAKHVKDSQYCLQIVKCKDNKCCAPYRSNLTDILQNGFLPPPIPIQKNLSSGRLHVPLPAMNVTKFAPLLLQLSVKLQPEQKDFLKLPYDFYCPTVSEDLIKRTCRTCGSYFASAKSLSAHIKNLHNKTKQIQKRKAKTIAAKRNDEVLCIFECPKFNTKDAEWQNENDIQCELPSISSGQENLTSFVEITSINEWL